MQLDLRQGTGIVIGTECYRFAERIRDKERTPLFRHVRTDEPRTISDGDIAEMIARAEIQFLTSAELARAEQTGEPPGSPNYLTLDDINSLWERERTRRYDKYVQGWIRAGQPSRSDRHLQIVIAHVADELGDPKPPHPRTLRTVLMRWLHSGGTLDGLISNKRRCGARSNLTGIVRQLVEDVIYEHYLTLERPDVTDSYEVLKRKVQTENHRQAPGAPRVCLPSLSQFRREVGKIDKFTVMMCREGKRAAMTKFGPRYAGADADRHNYRWELDSTVADIMLIDPDTGEAIGRPTVTVVIDTYTRVVVGFYIGWESESFQTFTAAMANALQSKAHVHERYPDLQHRWEAFGTPVYVAVDNHAAYVSQACRDTFARLKIDVLYTPVLKAWWKGIIERFFNTLTHKVFQRVPGTTFSNIFERNKETIPESIAIATLDELRELVTRWIVDEYHYKIHRGIKQPPAMLYQESARLHRTVPPPSMKTMAFAFSEIHERTLHHYGVELFGMKFNLPRIANIKIAPGREQRVRVAINYQNLDAVSVFDPHVQEWVHDIPRYIPALKPDHVLTWADYQLQTSLLKARSQAFVEANGYAPPNDLVEQWVAPKRPEKSKNKATRGSRYKFNTKPYQSVAPVVDTDVSAQPVSDTIFGTEAEDFEAPVPSDGEPQPAAQATVQAGQAHSPGTPQVVSHDRTSEETATRRGADIDLRAEAARRGIITYRKE